MKEELHPITQELTSRYQYPIEHSETERVSNVAIQSPGQDIHGVGMFDQIMQHPSGLEVVQRANNILGRDFGFAITTDDDLTPESEVFRKTRYIQPRVFVATVAHHNINKHERELSGYATQPRFETGNSMGMVAAAVLSGALPFEQGVRLIAVRAILMEELSADIPTGMKSAMGVTDEQFEEALARHPEIDKCLINPTGIVYGGPLEALSEMSTTLKGMKVKSVDVNAPMAMHSRYVKPAEAAFSKYVDLVKFQDPLIPCVGTLTKKPIRTGEGMAEELKYGFAHTFDNKGIMEFMDDAGVRIISELHPKGIFGKALERTAGAVTLTGDLGHAVGRSIVGGVEVLLPHHPQHPKHNGGK